MVFEGFFISRVGPINNNLHFAYCKIVIIFSNRAKQEPGPPGYALSIGGRS